MASLQYDIEMVSEKQLKAMNVTKEQLYQRNREKDELNKTVPPVETMAPDFEAERLSPDGERTGNFVRISSFRGAPVGLLFGSYTCPIFRDQIGRYEEIYRELNEQVHFLCVYIKEAHPDEGWRVPHNFEHDIFISQPASLDERAQVANICLETMNMTIPMALDTMDDALLVLYSATPERLYALNADGLIVYRSDIGPFDGDDVEGWYQALKAEI